MQNHHSKVLNELRAQQRNQITLKQKEQRRKLSEVLKEHEEEIENLKRDQEQNMLELIKSQQFVKNENESISDDVHGNAHLTLPSYILEDLQAGRTPEPVDFNAVTMIFAGI